MGTILKVKNGTGAWFDIPYVVGKSAYGAAVDGGYEGTEDEFNASMAEVANKATIEEIRAIITGAIEGSY